MSGLNDNIHQIDLLDQFDIWVGTEYSTQISKNMLSIQKSMEYSLNRPHPGT